MRRFPFTDAARATPSPLTHHLTRCATEDRELVELHEAFKHKGFHVLAFPSPEFGDQEFKTTEEIADFVAGLGVDFHMMAPVEVNGVDASPVFTHLKGRSRGAAHAPLGAASADITWNFASKFLVARDGLRIERFDRVDPAVVQPYIERMLDAELRRRSQRLCAECNKPQAVSSVAAPEWTDAM